MADRIDKKLPDGMDSFWDISSDVFTPAPTRAQKDFAAQIELAEVRSRFEKETSSYVRTAREQRRAPSLTDTDKAPASTDRQLHFADKNTSIDTYSLADNPFIKEISVQARFDAGTFYRQFFADAVRLLPATGSETAYTPFFSYMPQYSQMNRQQIAYYVWWRSEVRQGNYPKADESYLLLYVYELLNLGGSLISREEALISLCETWRAYRKTFPRLNKFFADWIADFCLVFRLPIPYDRLRPMMREVLSDNRLRELYLGSLAEITVSSVDTLLALLSNYDWHTSRYAKGQTASAYERHLSQSLFEVFRHLFGEGKLPLRGAYTVTVSRNAFVGAVWAHDTRYYLRVTYHPFSDVGGVRTLITQAVKYSENQLRAKLGLRSRLSVDGVDEECKRRIDAYYRVMYREEKPEKKSPPPPAYEALYEAQERGMEAGRAEEIEALSWENTRRLVPEEEEEAPSPTMPTILPISNTADEYLSENDTFTREETEFLSAIYEGRPAPCDPATADVLAERINACARDRMGDVVLERMGDVYTVIPDYLDEVKEWLKK